MKINKTIFLSTLIILSVIATSAYVIVRITLFLFAGYTAFEKLLSVLLLLGESFVLVHALGYVFNIIKVFRTPRVTKREETIPIAPDKEPPLAILVAARHEPKIILDGTFRSLRNVNYGNKYIYFLDDSTEDRYKAEANDLAKEHNLILFRRKQRHGAKAGIINDCLKDLPHEYVAVFDADQNPLPEFFNTLIPLMEKDKKLGFIQTPQFYSNMEESNVARGAGFQQSVFYEYICEGKNTGGAMFCCGTNIVFRRTALMEIGGFDESTVTEDFATSFRLQTHGWKSAYYNHVSAFGMGPENLTGYFKQQFRWAAGTISIFKELLWKLLTKPFLLTPIQWWEYFLSSSYYFVGLAFFFLMICPIMYLLFNVPSFFVKPEIYFLAFLPYIAFSISVFYAILGTRHYKVKDLFLGQLLGIITFPIYLRAVCFALLGLKTTFGITGKTKSRAIPYFRLWPQLTFIFLNIIAAIWGFNRFIYEREPAVLVNGFWAFYHFALLSSIFYFNDEDMAKISCKWLRNDIKFDYKLVAAAKENGGLSRKTWRDCFSVFIAEHLEAGTLVMCKIAAPGVESFIFDGRVMWSREKKTRRGFETNIGLVAASKEVRDNLMKITRR
ncbi:MAG: glycosyltransferase [Omnitrophica bacterium]|nr:glycosyltransferase [Candidatus Omnitrophota bacterium]